MTSDLKPLLEAVHAVMRDVGYVQKDGQNVQQKYRFASEAAFIAALRPAMVTHGLVLLPLPTEEPIVLETFPRAEGKVSFRAVVRRRYLLGHTSGGTLTLGMEGEGIDTSDKAVPKACTQAMKWLLRQLFIIETGLEPDRENPEAAAGPSAAFKAALGAVTGAADIAGLNAVRSRISGSDKLNDHEKASLMEACESRKWELDNG